MDDRLKDAIARAIHSGLVREMKRGRTDPIHLAERLTDDIEVVMQIHTEESGIAPVTADNAVWDMDRAEPVSAAAPPPPQAYPPASPALKSELLVMPGDPDFKPPELPKTGRMSVRRRPNAPINTSDAEGNKKVWQEGDLISAILKNTPDKIYFTPEGTDMQTYAVRNTANQPGIGVKLIYKHPAAADTSGHGADISGEAKMPLDLMASAFFSSYVRSHDFAAAVEKITADLPCIYRARNEETPPTVSGRPPVLGAGPTNFNRDSLPMGDGLSESEGRMDPSVRAPARSYNRESVVKENIKLQPIMP